MKILAVADEVSRYYYDFYKPGVLNEFDLIIACGDLPKGYLEFLVTLAHCPLIYVHGNHDDAYADDPPLGCICIDDTVYEFQGIRFFGLGGSYRYRKDAIYMYKESQMKLRIFKCLPQLFLHHGFDVLVTHAPSFQFGDQRYLAHRGFHCFDELILHFHPAYMIHGHIHRNYGYKIPQKYSYLDTEIINAFEYCKIEINKKEN